MKSCEGVLHTLLKENRLTMKSIHSRRLSLLLSIVLLIVMTACASSVSKEESSEAGSSDRIEEVQAVDESEAEQGQVADESAAEQGQSADESAAEQGQAAVDATAEQGQVVDESAAEQGKVADESAVEQGKVAEDAIELLKQADEAAQEKYDNMDLNDKESVMEMIQALTQMESAIQLAKNQQIATWDDDRKILSIDEEIRCVRVSGGTSTTISYMKGRKGLVIVHYGGDDYYLYYVCDGTLIGRESGHSTGRLDFSGCLPDWKDDPTGETHSIIDGREVKDHYGDYEYDKEVKRAEEYLQEAEEVLDEAGE